MRQGFHATSMQDLLTEAGMSSGAAYGYFASKDEIILAVAEENIARVAGVLRVVAADPGHTPATALTEVLELIRSENAQNDFAKLAASGARPSAADRSAAAAATAIVTGYILQLALEERVTVRSLPDAFAALAH